jgi:hypothetical protein
LAALAMERYLMTVVTLGKLRSETIVNSIDHTGFSCLGADSALTAFRPGYDQWIKRNRWITKLTISWLVADIVVVGVDFQYRELKIIVD